MRRRPEHFAGLAVKIQTALPCAPLVEKHFDLGPVLGRGSFSVVRRACCKHGPDRTEVALKTYFYDGDEKLEFAHREFQISRLLAGLPNLAVCMQLFEDLPNKRVDLVMQLAAGETLATLLKHSTFSEARARPVLVGILQAVHSCHSRRVCHRDIKPDNIVVQQYDSGEVSVMLCDFNSAACLGQQYLARWSGSLTPAGSHLFAAPEIHVHSHGALQLADVWSTGLCLHLMLTGRPFVQRAFDTLTCSLSLILPKALTHEVCDLLELLLATNPMQRCLVPGALAHPWCRLSAAEHVTLFLDGRCPRLNPGSLARRGAWPPSWTCSSF